MEYLDIAATEADVGDSDGGCAESSNAASRRRGRRNRVRRTNRQRQSQRGDSDLPTGNAATEEVPPGVPPAGTANTNEGQGGPIRRPTTNVRHPCSRAWLFTLNNPPAEYSIDWSRHGELIRYAIYQREVGAETHTPHLQGYVELYQPRRLRTMRNIIEGAHWEPRRGTRDQARDYCRKEDTRVPGTEPIEFGNWASGGQGVRNDIAEVCEDLESLSVRQAIIRHPVLAARYPKFFTAYRNAITGPREWLTEVHIFIGPTGTGKTREAWRRWPDLWVYPGRGWFDGYDGHRVVLFDDFDGSEVDYRVLLRLLDRYPMDVPIKGAFVPWKPRIIVITSNLEISDWYNRDNPSRNRPLFRRITSITRFSLPPRVGPRVVATTRHDPTNHTIEEYFPPGYWDQDGD